MDKQRIYLVLDIGTTAVKVTAVDDTFHMLKTEGMEYQLITNGNQVEMRPETYWEVIQQGISLVIDNINKENIAGISVTSQGETLIAADCKGKPLYNAIVWLDSRAEEEAEQIQKVYDSSVFYTNTGIPECNGLCPISKLLWFKNKKADIYHNTKYFLLLEDYIIYRLTGKFVTEKSLLSTTGYFNILTDEIWDEILFKVGLDRNKIPTVLECGSVVGDILPCISQQLGLPEDIKVVTGAMDQVCGAIGAGNIKNGIVTETTGTALCIGATVDKKKADISNNVPIYRHYNPQFQLLLPVCMTAGMALKWFKDHFCELEQEMAKSQGQSVYDIMDKLAEASEPLAGGVIMLPYLSGSLQPYHAPDLRASFLEVSLDNTKADFIRSLMEGVGYMLKENLQLLEKTCGSKIERVISMGGGSKSDIWCEIKANISNVMIEVNEQSETASIGAAMLCAVGLGDYPSLEETVILIEKNKKRYKPNKELVQKYEIGFKRYMMYLDLMVTKR